MSDTPTVEPTVNPTKDAMALGVAVREGAVTAVTVRREPLRVTGLLRASIEGCKCSPDPNTPSLMNTLRRKLRADANTRTVVVFQSPGADWFGTAELGAGSGAEVAVAPGWVDGSGADGPPQVLIPPALLDTLDPHSDLPAIAAAVAELDGGLEHGDHHDRGEPAGRTVDDGSRRTRHVSAVGHGRG